MADAPLDYGDPSEGYGASRDTEYTEYTRGSEAAAATMGTDSTGEGGTLGQGTSSWQNSYDGNAGGSSADGFLQDDAMDAEMRAWEENYDGLPDEYDTRREAKLAEVTAARSQAGTRFYALPRDEAVKAGARRGVVSASGEALSDANLMGGLTAADEGSAAPEAPTTIGQGLDIRYAVIHMEGLPVTQCSTSRLFAYVTHFGAQPLGLEWVDDASCNIVFSDANAARIAIEYLCPATDMSTAPLIPLPTDRDLDEAAQLKRLHDSGEDPDRAQNHEWPSTFMQSLLTPRKAHRFPGKLYNAPERDAAAELAENVGASGAQAASQLPDDVPEIYREMEAEDRLRQLQQPHSKALANLRSNLWLRWAVESLDVKGSGAAKKSKWYREHGMDAGRDVVPKMLEVGGAPDRLELLPGSNENGPRKRGRGGRSAAMDDMDRELDTWREDAEEASEDQYRSEARRSRGRRGGRRGKGRFDGEMDALDEDLEMEVDAGVGGRSRSASPVRWSQHNEEASNGTAPQVRVRGRGRMRAPSAWDDADAGGQQGAAAWTSRGGGAQRGGMLADEVERRRRRGGGQRRRRTDERNGGWDGGNGLTTLEDRFRTPRGGNSGSGSLESRFGPPQNGGTAGLHDRIL